MSDFSALKELFFDESSLFLRGILSKPTKNARFKKIRITPVKIKDTLHFHVEQFTEKQAFQKNMNKVEIIPFLENAISKEYRTAVFETNTKLISFLTNKKGEISVIKNKTKKENNYNATKNIELQSQNRKKHYILQEGIPVPFLVELGIMTKDGNVIAQKYNKFRQLNRFLEYIDDVLSNVLIQEDGKEKPEISVIDIGFGKSYLTFAVYYYLVVLKNKNAHCRIGFKKGCN